jgi:hypothetical protein
VNYIGQLMAADFFVVPTVTDRLLFVLVILAHERIRHWRFLPASSDCRAGRAAIGRCVDAAPDRREQQRAAVFALWRRPMTATVDTRAAQYGSQFSC